MKRRLIIGLVVLAIGGSGKAQTIDVIPSSNAIANTATARNDVWSAFQNPASLVQADRFMVAAQYENKSLVGAFSTEMVAASYTNRYVNVGVAYSFFGYSKYSEMMAAVALSRSFGRFSLGLGCNVISLYAGDDLGYRTTAVPQIGVVVEVIDDLSLGFQSFNPFIQSLKIGDGRRLLPAIYSLGMDYRFYKNMRLDVQVDYDVNTTFKVALGYEWQAVSQFCLKVGAYYEQYVVACLGAGLCFGGFRMDVDAELHPVLGVNLRCKLAYQWK